MSWQCTKCGQTNSDSQTTCGRCEDDVEPVRLRLALTPDEYDVLARLLRDVSNEPSDVDYQTYLALLGKIEQPNTPALPEPSGDRQSGLLGKEIIMPVDESSYTACMDCKRGCNFRRYSEDACASGWRVRTRKMGCYGGPRIPGTKARKGEQGYVPNTAGEPPAERKHERENASYRR